MSEIKLCKDCKWYTVKSSGPEFAKCVSPRVASKVDGSAVEFCSIRRMDQYEKLPIFCKDEWEQRDETPLIDRRAVICVYVPNQTTDSPSKPWWRFW